MEHTKLIEQVKKELEDLYEYDFASDVWDDSEVVFYERVVETTASVLNTNNQKLVDALWKIANGAAPYNQLQLESWRETAIEIAQQTLNEITK